MERLKRVQGAAQGPQARHLRDRVRPMSTKPKLRRPAVPHNGTP